MIKSAFAPVVAASIALLLGHAAVAGSEEVREAPKALRGVWKARSVSKDQGKTEDQIRPMTVATVSANKVKHPTGSTVNLDKVVVVRENGAGPLSLFKMSDGTVFAVTEKKTPGLFMMQVLGGSPMKETVRFGFAVEK